MFALHPIRVRAVALFATVGVFGIALAACGGGGSDPVSPSQPVSVSVTPSSATMNAGATAQFSASVANSSNGGVTWSASAGTIAGTGSTVTYTAPVAGGQYTVTATSAADASKSAQATITVNGVGVTVAAVATSLGAGGTTQLTATVTNSANSAVNWTATGGTITGTGATVTYNAPAAGGSYVVTATSAADATKSASTTITVTPVTVSVTPTTQTLYRGEPVTINTTVGGTDTKTVTYTASCGAISGSGLSVTFTAPQTSGPCTVTAKSSLDVTKTAVATLTTRNAWRVAALDDVDDGACTWTHCSLREAITAANASSSVDTIQIVPAGTAAATIILTAALPVITTPVHIIGPGAALLVINAGATTNALRRVLDYNGTAVSSVTALTLRGGIATTDGGGVSVQSSADVSFTDVNIIQNEARGASGGGLFVNSNAIARLLRVLVDTNKVTGANQPGGGISVVGAGRVTISGGSVSANAVADGWGGGIRVLGAVLTMDNVMVRANAITAGVNGGAGMFVEGATSTATISASTITANTTSTGEAGGLKALTGVAVTITNTDITNNTALTAGGVSAGNVGAFTMTGGSISSNTSATRAGGMFVWGSSDVSVTNTAISSNSAQSTGGGGVYVQDAGKARLTGVTINNNRVTGVEQHGGGVWASAGTTIILSGATISGNETANGGGAGIYAFGNSVTLTNTTISGNAAKTNGNGGAMALFDGVALVMNGGVVKDNTSINDGGGIIMRGSTAQISDAEFSGNSTGFGGALYVTDANTVTLTRVTMKNNRATFTGGAIGQLGTGSLTITGSTFTGNMTTSLGGGAIIKVAPATLTISQSRFSANQAATDGGAFNLSGSGVTTMTGVTVSDNIAGTEGGGIINLGTLNILNSTLSTNLATTFGGALSAVTGSNTNITNSTVFSNRAATGGALGVRAIVIVKGSTIANNTATVGGGGVALQAGTFSAGTSILSNNLLSGTSQNCLQTLGAEVSSGGNLVSDLTCSAFQSAFDKFNTPAGLATVLADNGGTTQTVALLAGSAAINNAGTTVCTAADQRGYSRVGVCDSGAYEFGGVAPAGVRAADVSRSIAPAVTSPTPAHSTNATSAPHTPRSPSLRVAPLPDAASLPAPVNPTANQELLKRKR